MAFAFGGMLVFAAEKNHKWWLRRQEQLPRFQKVRATVLDTGLGERGRWISFTCRTRAGDVRGSRVSSSGSQAYWQGFEKGHDYDAFHDPIFEECVLLVDEEVQAVNPELRASREAARWFAGLGAAFGLLAFGLAVARRRLAAQPRAPGDAAAPGRRI